MVAYNIQYINRLSEKKSLMVTKAVLYIIFTLSIYHQSAGQYRYGENLGDSVLFAARSVKNQLYVGIDNPLVLNIGAEKLPENYSLSSSNGIVFFDSTEFVTIPSRSGISRIIVSEIKNNDTILVGYRFFKVINVPDPMLRIDTLIFSEEDNVYRHFLLNADSLGIFFTNDIPGSENWFRIIRYTIGYIYGGLYRSYEFKGNKISNKVKEIINTLGPGKEIIIKPYVEGEGNLNKELPIYRLKIY